MEVVVVRQKRDEGVDGDHEEDADDVLLFPGARVVEGMLEDEVHGDDDGDAAGNGGDEKTNIMEGDIVKVGDLAIDCYKSAERKL